MLKWGRKNRIRERWSLYQFYHCSYFTFFYWKLYKNRYKRSIWGWETYSSALAL